MFTSIAIDPVDRAHISYYDTTNRNLKYATNAYGAWSVSTIDEYDDVGWHTSIAIDEIGWAHISYYDYSNATLKYASFPVISSFEFPDIAPGWNLVSIPLVGHGYRASTLPDLSPGDMVSRWNPAIQAYDKSYVVGFSGSVSDFDIEPSWAYWVTSGEAKSIEISGYQPSGLQTRNITVPPGGGWVQIGLASLQTDLWASDLVGMYTTDLLFMVSCWDASTQTYDSYIVGFPVLDFPLSPGDGLWLFVGGSGVFSYMS